MNNIFRIFTASLIFCLNSCTGLLSEELYGCSLICNKQGAQLNIHLQPPVEESFTLEITPPKTASFSISCDLEQPGYFGEHEAKNAFARGSCRGEIIHFEPVASSELSSPSPQILYQATNYNEVILWRVAGITTFNFASGSKIKIRLTTDSGKEIEQSVKASFGENGSQCPMQGQSGTCQPADITIDTHELNKEEGAK